MFQIHQIPIRDWNTSNKDIRNRDFVGFKFTKSLLGIETWEGIKSNISCLRFKFTKSLLGIETMYLTGRIKGRSIGFKFTKSLLGIETGQ